MVKQQKSVTGKLRISNFRVTSPRYWKKKKLPVTLQLKLPVTLSKTSSNALLKFPVTVDVNIFSNNKSIKFISRILEISKVNRDEICGQAA